MHISQEYQDNGGKFVLALYASPSRPGWVRHIGCQVLVEGEDGKLPPGLGFFALPMPVWLSHVLASVSGSFNAVLVNGDIVGETLFYGRGAGQDPTSSSVISAGSRSSTAISSGW